MIQEKESIYIKYLDANNLYGWAMSTTSYQLEGSNG